MREDLRATASALAGPNPRQVVTAVLSPAHRSIRLSEPIGKGPGLTPGQRLLLPLEVCLSQLQSGGFHSLLASETGTVAAEMLAGLKEIGATKAHALVAEAFAVFPRGEPPRSTMRREAILDQLPEAAMYRRFDRIERKLNPLIESEVYPRIAAHIRGHADDFLRDTSLPSRRMVNELKTILGKRLAEAPPALIAQLAALGVPDDVLAFYRLVDWRTGVIEHRDARLRNLRGVLLLNRSDFRRIACEQGFVVIADTRTERNAFAVATTRQTVRPVGTVFLFSSRKQLYRSPENAPRFAQHRAADFASFLKSFLAGTLRTFEFLQPSNVGLPKPTWRPVA